MGLRSSKREKENYIQGLLAETRRSQADSHSPIDCPQSSHIPMPQRRSSQQNTLLALRKYPFTQLNQEFQGSSASNYLAQNQEQQRIST